MKGGAGIDLVSGDVKVAEEAVVFVELFLGDFVGDELPGVIAGIIELHVGENFTKSAVSLARASYWAGVKSYWTSSWPWMTPVIFSGRSGRSSTSRRRMPLGAKLAGMVMAVWPVSFV